MKDYEGNEYGTIKVEYECWIKENLKSTKYSNGDIIGTTDPVSLDIRYESNPKYQWAYNGDENYAITYGRLYTYYTTNDIRNVCPTGWHVPNNDEWVSLFNFLGGESIAGGKLKETGIIHWKEPNTGATDAIGFKALPGGYRTGSGYFFDIKNTGKWWSKTISGIGSAYGIIIYYDNINIVSYNNDFPNGLSIRCIKD